MKGNQHVIERLNQLLAGELTAIDQYFIHSRMYENWGFGQLFERINHEMQDETGHATVLIQRILFLGGIPNVEKRDSLTIGNSVAEMLKNDLALERQVRAALAEVIAFCESVQDYVSRDILQIMLKDTEDDHMHWLEQQLGLIEKIGLQNYLQSQL